MKKISTLSNQKLNSGWQGQNAVMALVLRHPSGPSRWSDPATRRTLLIMLVLSFSAVATAGEPVEIGSRRELFVDSHIIDQITGKADLRLHHQVPREVSIVHDAPWEGTSSGYHSVFKDGDLYRMYYRGLHLQVSEGKISTGKHKPYYCYAESADGIHWKRPELGIVEFNGSKKNNIILEGIGVHNFSPFKDDNPNCAADAKYKGIGGLQHEGGLHAFKSADGVHWSLLSEKPVITVGAFDSQNLAFFDKTIGKYRAYYRIFTGGTTTKKVWKPSGIRAIRTATSDDFIHWSNEADLTYEDSPDDELYTNQIKPYHRAPHILIGIPTRYVERGWSPSMKALPELKNRELRSSAHQRYGTGITEGLLMASRDGVKFKRWNEAFLQPGIGRDGTWQYGQHYAAWHVVETASALPGAPNELSIYSTEGYWHGNGGTLRRYTLRLDGFVSAYAPMKGGELLTKPIIFDGSKLEINFATSAAGSIKVEIQNADGVPFTGNSFVDCPEHYGDNVAGIITWKNGADVSSLIGKPVRLKFKLKDAHLYSFRFIK